MKSFRHVTMLALLVLTLGGCATTHDLGGSPGGGNVLIAGAQVFDGQRLLGRRDVLVEGGIIRKVAAHIERPSHATIIEGAGKTLIPGLIDAHVHSIPGGPADALRFGVTSEFDLYSFGDRETARERKAHRLSIARTNEADVWSSGFGITPPGGHPSELFKDQPGVPPIPTLAEGADPKAFVAARVAEGADYIKVIEDDGARIGFPVSLPAFSLSRFAEVMQAAKDTGLKVLVHVQQLAYAKAAVAGGADALAHALADAPPDDELITAMKARKVALIATLAVYDGIGGGGGAHRLMSDPAIAPYLSATQKMLMGLPLPPDPVERANALETVRRLHRAGILILAGTDAPNPTTGFGVSMQLEMELLVEAGLSPVEALQAATANPAAFYGATDRGRIKPGLRGDLVLIDGDPTRSILAARRIEAVFKNGWQIDRGPPSSQ